MGHHGQKLGLGTVGGFGLIPCPRQLLFPADLGADIPGGTAIPGKQAMVVKTGLGAHLHPAGAIKQRHLHPHPSHRQALFQQSQVFLRLAALLVANVVIERRPGRQRGQIIDITGLGGITETMFGIGLPKPVRGHGGETTKTTLTGLQRVGFHRDLILQTSPVGDVDQRLSDKRAAALNGSLAVEIEGTRP